MNGRETLLGNAADSVVERTGVSNNYRCGMYTLVENVDERLHINCAPYLRAQRSAWKNPRTSLNDESQSITVFVELLLILAVRFVCYCICICN